MLKQSIDLQVRVPAEVQVAAGIAVAADDVPQDIGPAWLLQAAIVSAFPAF